MPIIDCPHCGEKNNDINSYCLKCKTQLPLELRKSASLDNIEKKPVRFVKMSAAKVFFLSLLTLGLYDLFWFYKQWAARYRGRRYGGPGLAVFASLFRHISVFYLAALINKDVRKNNEDVSPEPFIYLCSLVFVRRIFFVEGTIEALVAYAVQRILAAAALSSLQSTINIQEEDDEYKKDEKGLKFSDIVCVILAAGYIFFIANFMLKDGRVFISANKPEIINAEKWKKYSYLDSITFRSPYELHINNDEAKEMGVNERYAYEGGDENAFYIYLTLNVDDSPVEINWDNVRQNLAEEIGVSVDEVKVEYKLYGNNTGRLFTVKKRKDNIQLNTLFVAEKNKLYTFSVSNFDMPKYNEAAVKIINSITFGEK